MPKPLVILICALLAGVIAYWLIGYQPSSEQQPTGALGTSSTDSSDGYGKGTGNPGNGPIVVPASEVALFEEQYAEAVTELAAAESRLEDLASRLDGVEAQVADIEARGDDPADHLGEVLPYMQPILDEYLDAESALEDALERRDATKAALDAAIDSSR